MAAYEYCTFRIERAAWPRFTSDVFGAIDEATRDARGSVFLLCAGMIGFASDEGVLVRAWPDQDTLNRQSASTLATTHLLRESATETLVPTARPVDTTPPREPGVYAHRWFWLQPKDWDEFQQLSQDGIWPYFESDGCQIVGLWRADEAASTTQGLIKTLLITRYPSVAHWERTRLQSADPPPGAAADLYRRAQEAGRQRAAITDRSIVRLTRILLPRA